MKPISTSLGEFIGATLGMLARGFVFTTGGILAAKWFGLL